MTRLLTGVLALAVVAACSATRRSETLGRETAATMLNEQKSAIFAKQSTNADWSLPLRYFPKASVVESRGVEFCDRLVLAGILEKSTPGAQSNYIDYVLPALPIRLLPYVRLNGDRDHPYAIFTLATASFSLGSIAGVLQNGPDATVDVPITLTYTPTPMHETLLTLATEMAPKLCPGPYVSAAFCGILSTAPKTVGETRTASFAFKRYDDGWRFIGPVR